MFMRVEKEEGDLRVALLKKLFKGIAKVSIRFGGTRRRYVKLDNRIMYLDVLKKDADYYRVYITPISK